MPTMISKEVLQKILNTIASNLNLKADADHTHDEYITETMMNTAITNATKIEDYNVVMSNLDDNNIYTTVTYNRTDGTTYMTSVLSNPNDNGNYLTCTWTYYDTDGTTVTQTKVWTITYDDVGNILTVTKQV